MKIYSRIVIDIASGGVVEEIFEEHSGEVALCKGGDSESGPRELNPEEVELWSRYFDYTRYVQEGYPPEEALDKFMDGINYLMDNANLLSAELRAILPIYLTDIDDIDEAWQALSGDTEALKAGLKPAYGGVLKMFDNASQHLSRIAGEIADNPNVFNKAFMNVKNYLLQEKDFGERYRQGAIEDYDKFASGMPTLRFGDTIMPQHRPRKAEAARDRAVEFGSGIVDLATQGLTGINEGYMDTLTGSQDARANIFGKLQPDIYSRKADTLTQKGNLFGELDKQRGNILGERTDLLGKRLQLETAPIEFDAQMIPMLAELLGLERGATKEWIDYIEEIQKRRANQGVSETEGAGGFGIGFGPIEIGAQW